MKKELLLLLLIGFFASAQTINFPDPNFKTYLIEEGYDLNGDNNIQIAEAQAVYNMQIVHPTLSITSIVGIEHFINLQTLQILETNVASANLTALVDLDHVTFGYNSLLTNIQIAGMSDLQGLTIEESPLLSQVSLTGLTSLQGITLVNCGLLHSIDVSPCIGLSQIHLINTLQSLDVSGLPLLFALIISGEQFSSLTLNNCPNLTYVDIEGTSITDLDFTQCPSIADIEITDASNTQNAPGTLNVSGCDELQALKAEFSRFSTLNASGCDSLFYINLNDSWLTSLNIEGCNTLGNLHLSGNNLTSVDASSCGQLSFLDLSGNELQYLNIKNGSVLSNWYMEISSLPIYICGDDADFQQDYMQEYIALSSGQVVWNSYCSFTPGGNYNTITGNIRLDVDNNGCTDADFAMPFARIAVSDGEDSGSIFTNSDGFYSVFAQMPNMTLSPQIANPSQWSVTPSSQSFSFSTFNFSTETQNFCVIAVGLHPDASVVIIPLVPAMPGFDAVYQIILSNNGNQVLSGDLNFNFNGDVLDLISANPAVSAQTDNSLSWNYSGLLPFQSAEFLVTLNVNSPMETPAVNLNDVLVFSADAYVTVDENPSDNQFSLNQIVIGSYDPNDITCLEGAQVSDSAIGDYLHYVINFENTGTAAATNVVVKNVIDPAMYDLSSLQVIETSHPSMIRVTGNTLEFIHENIMLGEAEKGHVVYKIKSLPALTTGATVLNSAEIFFDYNFPVVTNVASTTFTSLGTPGFGLKTLTLSPNPTTGTFTVDSSSAVTTVSIFDIRGQLVLKAGAISVVDVSNFGKGVYLVKVETSDGITTQKLIKN